MDYTVSLVVDSFLTWVIESMTEAILITNLPPIVEAACVSSSKDESDPKEVAHVTCYPVLKTNQIETVQRERSGSKPWRTSREYKKIASI